MALSHVSHPQLARPERVRNTTAQYVVHVFAVGRKHRREGEPFGRDLALSASIMQPDGALFGSYGGDERAPVGTDKYSIFLRDVGGKLLRSAIRESLLPEVEATSGIRGKIHPGTIWRPGSLGTLGTGWSHLFPKGTAIKWN